ncbi:hypothetical protein M433DRAFT_68893 [Acidomyces richmondensis BFW]|nr:MAG: hypothetical protein FE78DRAFT_151220 [Acidomyces sp. 'richmondensis']KYG44673.1 hypothetical protein M433DRAFT_68893 [Acidomyces richmondensis BFW]
MEVEKSQQHAKTTVSSDATQFEVKRSKHGVKLEPQPSDDPQDPLNWSMRRKITILGVICLSAFAGIAQGGANVSGVVVQSFTYHKSVGAMVDSLSAGIAGTCSGPIFAMALAHYIGRCPVILWGLLLSMCNVWSASMTGPHDYIAFCISRWLAGTFGAFPTALGGGFIVDMFFLHQRGKAFAFYTTCAIFGVAFANTFSGFIVSHAGWPAQFWWVIGMLGLCFILVAIFVEDTTYPREGSNPPPKVSTLSQRILTFVPVRGNMERCPSNTHGPFDSILIGIQPPTLLAGCFIMLVFCWSTAVLNNLSVYLQLQPLEGGYGFTPQQNALFSFTNWISTAVAQLFGYLFNDRIPLWRCRRSGGIWRPEFRLYPLLAVPMTLSPIALGVFGASLEHHYHYMVLAFAVWIMNIADVICLPIVNAYVVECFLDYAAEVTTILTFYRLIFGLCISFFLPAWTAAVGIGWTYGMMAFFVLIAYGLTWILELKGPAIREMSMSRFKSNEEGEKLFGE